MNVEKPEWLSKMSLVCNRVLLGRNWDLIRCEVPRAVSSEHVKIRRPHYGASVEPVPARASPAEPPVRASSSGLSPLAWQVGEPLDRLKRLIRHSQHTSIFPTAARAVAPRPSAMLGQSVAPE